MSPEQPVISLRGVGKTFRTFARPSDRVRRWLSGGRAGHCREHAVLAGIDLDVMRGETLGIVGRNGSGKSTLLRILSGIMQPSEGTVAVRGRVAPLLALGAGFHPEFTGRENVELNATLLGLDEREMRRRMPAIVDFAEIGDAIDDPVSTYSSGMFARLAFAVAVSGDPEILVVDEILAVGDAAFARKCHARIEEIQRSGSTVLFVSHQQNTVIELCNRAVLLEGGRIDCEGSPREVMRRYHAMLFAGTGAAVPAEVAGRTEAAEGDDDDVGDAPDPQEYPSDGATILSLRFADASGRTVRAMRLGAEYVAEIRVRFDRAAEGVTVGFHFRNEMGVTLAGLFHPPQGDALSVHELDEATVRIPFRMTLLAGDYFATFGVRSRLDERHMHRLVDFLRVSVHADGPRVHQGYSAIDAGPPVVDLRRHAARG
ncbi:MAG: ABC transporter ATP-binding protein [Phycisphaerales bacterium]